MTVKQFYSHDPLMWCQHALVNEHGQRCLEGALIYVYGDHTDAMIDAKRKLERTLCENGWFMSIPAFNDAGGTTFEKVKKIVDEAGI